MDGETYDEDAHPRDEAGRFTSGGGGGGAAGPKEWAKQHSGGDSSHGGGAPSAKDWAGGAKPGAPRMSLHERERMKETVDALKSKIEGGKLKPGVSLGQHVSIAKGLQGAHEAEFAQQMKDLKELAPPDAIVKGRVKKLESILGKLDRKPKYGTAEGMQDITGMRVTVNSLEDVDKTVAGIKGKYRIVEEDNYIHSPKPENGYRSYHLIIETSPGVMKEVQIRTHDQNKHAEWAHDVYKPQTKAQKEALEKHGDEIQAYSKAVAEHFHAKALGRPVGPKPRPSAAIREHFGEIAD